MEFLEFFFQPKIVIATIMLLLTIAICLVFIIEAYRK